MHYSNVSIRNFRSIQAAEVELSQFVCAVGHNNAGKSSLLLALNLLRSGTQLSSSDYYDQSKSISIQASLCGITDLDLQVLDAVHREKLTELISDGTLTLVRRYPEEGGKSQLLCTRWMPADTRFHPDSLKTTIKGSGKALRESFLGSFPELEHLLDESIKKQADYRIVLEKHTSNLSKDDLVLKESPLPTGIEQSIVELLPEAIFIPAVKDVRDELKTTESASFGKIISVLMDVIKSSEDFKAIEGSFSELNKLINRQVDSEGTVADERLDEVQEIERSVGGYVREQFRNVELSIEIPPPSVRDVFRNARIKLHDGVEGDVDSKGDGVKRAVTFALLRTFVDLRNKRRELLRKGDLSESPFAGHFLFLFEEPELYLHPNAQRILYDALRQIASDHQVCVCTLTVLFLAAGRRNSLAFEQKFGGGIRCTTTRYPN